MTSDIRPITFHWKVGYMGEVDYEVYGDEPQVYRVSRKYSFTEYERSIYNGTSAEFDRDVVSRIGILRRCLRSDEPVKPEVLAAFNAWQLAEHEASRASFLARHGEEDTRQFFTSEPPTPAVAGYYDHENKTGWIRV